MMSKDAKKNYVEEMKKSFTSNESVMIAQYQGLNVNELDALRKELREKGILFKITKNRITKIAIKETPKKDLEKFFDIFINEVKLALKNDERVELRGWGVFFTKNQKSKTSRNPKTGEKVIVDEKKSINFKMSKDLFNEINNE